MTVPLDLVPIEARDSRCIARFRPPDPGEDWMADGHAGFARYRERVWFDAEHDRRALLAEVKRLRAQVADAWDSGYRNGYSIGNRDDPSALTNYQNPYRSEDTP